LRVQMPGSREPEVRGRTEIAGEVQLAGDEEAVFQAQVDVRADPVPKAGEGLERDLARTVVEQFDIREAYARAREAAPLIVAEIKQSVDHARQDVEVVVVLQTEELIRQRRSRSRGGGEIAEEHLVETGALDASMLVRDLAFDAEHAEIVSSVDVGVVAVVVIHVEAFAERARADRSAEVDRGFHPRVLRLHHA
jgi:hypothetical protein